MSRQLLIFLLASLPCSVGADVLDRAQPLFRESCLDCHDESTDTALDIASLGQDLNDPDTFRTWERIFDRVSAGEMPPQGEDEPDKAKKSTALSSIEQSLHKANLAAQRKHGRVPLRRLTRTEYENTLHDLLYIDASLKQLLPEENASAGFDTVVSGQGISPLHIESYLKAADVALTAAIRLTERPTQQPQRFPYKEQAGVRHHIDSPRGKVIIRELDDAVVMFTNASHLFKLDGFRPAQAGRYRLRAAVSAFQTRKPVVFALIAGDYKRGSTRVLDFFDLSPGQPREVEVVASLDAGEYIYPAPFELESEKRGVTVWNRGANAFRGSGIAIKWIEVEGPLHDQWPPKSTEFLLAGCTFKALEKPTRKDGEPLHYRIVPALDHREQVERIVHRLAVRAFRRPLKPGEANYFVKLATDKLDNRGKLDDAVRVAARAIITSPSFLFLMSDPGELDDFALASRLSYFLWKSMPDAELFRVAFDEDLSDGEVLKQQVDRMLNSSKADAFKRDFATQWLRLSDIDATSPDKKLYPEFDELLRKSMIMETEAFIGALIDQNLSTTNLIDSNFAFLNRRLAEHYGIPNVEGQQIREVSIPSDSPRGGIMSQASILKVTANGTVTSPVRRGSWVLENLLGQPPTPPPADVGSIEPDTRGTTTIRQLLEAHRQVDTCASCHRTIDPPGFAMECFDVIGAFRERYRALQSDTSQGRRGGRRRESGYMLGPRVDASGTMPSGDSFGNFDEYKSQLLNQRDQVARNVISKLIVYATGSEIQFADRSEVEQVLKQVGDEYGMRSMIHAVVQSRVFRQK